MAKFVKVKKAPENLTKDECVISAPEFLDEVKSCQRRAPKNRYTTSNYMRDIAAAIGDKYMTDDFNALMTVNTSRFRGLPFENAEDVNEIVKKMLTRSAPEVFDRYVDYHIKQRPLGAKLIYFLGDHSQTGAFTRNGIDEIKEKDIDVYMDRKSKKKLGKPFTKKDENPPEKSENVV